MGLTLTSTRYGATTLQAVMRWSSGRWLLIHLMSTSPSRYRWRQLVGMSALLYVDSCTLVARHSSVRNPMRAFMFSWLAASSKILQEKYGELRTGH